MLKAVFEGLRVAHRRSKQATAKPILFAELYEACREFGLRIGHEEVDEIAGKGAVPDGIELEPPLGLIDAVLPQKTSMLQTWAELQATGPPAEGEQQHSRGRLSAVTLLKFKEMLVDMQEVLSSEPGSEASVGDDGGAGPLVANDEIDMDCEGIVWEGCEVRAVVWNEHCGWWVVTIVGGDGVETDEIVEPDEWDAHDVPPGSQHRGDGAVQACDPKSAPKPSRPAPADHNEGSEQTTCAKKKEKADGHNRSRKRAAGAKEETRHRKRASRQTENALLTRVRSTLEKLISSRFKCTCGTKTSFHGGGVKQRGLFDRGGFQRRMGEDIGVTEAEFDEVRAFCPRRRFV